MLKATSTPEIENKIRKQAQDLNLPITQYLAPFLKAIADGTLVMVPHFPPQVQGAPKLA
jgi:hypothetical protein